MADKQISESQLESLFSAARDAAPVPSADLLARVLADAQDAQPQPQQQSAAPRGGWLGRILRQVGGWPALAGMATATVAGVWIGYAQPSGLESLTASVWQNSDSAYDVVDLIPSLDGYLMEGDV